MKILLVSLLFITGNFNSLLTDSTWEVYNVSKKIDDNSIEDTFAIDYMINKEIVGTKVIIQNNKIILRGKIINQTADVTKIHNDYIIIKDNKNIAKIKYKISPDKIKCDFILPDGSILQTNKIK